MAADPRVLPVTPCEQNRTYELTRTSTGRVFVRYLPAGVAVGYASPDYLTVGTYPQANGYSAVQVAARATTASSTQSQSGALIVSDSTRPSSAYFSFPNAKFQVEVFHPTAGRARSLTESGRIVRVD